MMIETTADRPGKAVFCFPSEGGAFVLLDIAVCDESGPLIRDGEGVQLTPDEARRLAQALEDTALEVDLESA